MYINIMAYDDIDYPYEDYNYIGNAGVLDSLNKVGENTGKFFTDAFRWGAGSISKGAGDTGQQISKLGQSQGTGPLGIPTTWLLVGAGALVLIMVLRK